MLRHSFQKMALLQSPWLQWFIIKSPGQIRSKRGVTVPHCTSHCLASIKQMFSNMLPNINVTKRHNSVSIQQVRSYVHSIKTENQKDWLKRVRWGRNCQKNASDRCCRTNKAGIRNQLFAEEEFWPQNYNFSSKKSFLHQKKVCFSQKTRTSRLGTKQVEKVYRRIPPHLTYIGILLTRELRA